MRLIDADRLIDCIIDMEDNYKIKHQNINIINDQFSNGILSGLFNAIKEINKQDIIGMLPHAHWEDEDGNIVNVVNGIPKGSSYCSNCRKWLVGSDEYDIEANYCPNCGAKMDEVEKDATD